MRLKFCRFLFVVLVVLVIIAISPIHNLLHLGGDLRSFIPLLGVLGALLLVLAILTKMSRWPKFFFILTGASALGLPASLYLHDLLIRVFPTEPVTYVLLFYMLPVTFIIGMIGTVVTAIWQISRR